MALNNFDYSIDVETWTSALTDNTLKYFHKGTDTKFAA